MGNLEGKTAIVTGSGKGLGKAFCLGMATEGANVVMAVHRFDKLATQAAKEIEARGGYALEVDVTKEEDTLRMADETVKRFGRIDILVNNAGFLSNATLGLFTDIPLDELDKMLATHVKGNFLCSRAVFPQMKKQGYGKIINISSEVAFIGAPNFAHYSMAKGAITTLTRCLALECSRYGIRVNAVAPGMTVTEATQANDQLDKFPVSQIPLGRLGEPSDTVGAVIFFASEQSDYITGQVLLVNGGYCMH